MLIIQSELFKSFPEIIFGFSTKVGLNRSEPFFFNLSKSVGDDENIVNQNRVAFLEKLGLNSENTVIQKQIHSDEINIISEPEKNIIGDALITNRANIGLAISTADCTNIYLYDNINKVIAAVHSGWSGTEKKILIKILAILKNSFNVNPKNLYCYFGPSISQNNYEVGSEFTMKFDKKYLMPVNGKFKLDLKLANKDMLLDFGVPEHQIEISNICSYENINFHSYRRDGVKSGRAFGIIAMKGNNGNK